MPWKETTKVMLRTEFIRRALGNEESFSALCREYKISRPTGYKWLKRHLNGATLTELLHHELIVDEEKKTWKDRLNEYWQHLRKREKNGAEEAEDENI